MYKIELKSFLFQIYFFYIFINNTRIKVANEF